MSDMERAAFYQAHKDDSNVWGEDETSEAGAPRRPLGATITVRLSSEDAELLRRAARDLDVSYSDVVRQALKAYLSPRYTVEAGTGTSNNLLAALREAVTSAQQAPVSVTGVAHEESFTGNPRRLAQTA